MEITFIIIQGVLCITWLYLYGQQKEDKRQIKELQNLMQSVVHDLLLIMREKALENEDYRKVADIERILNKK